MKEDGKRVLLSIKTVRIVGTAYTTQEIIGGALVYYAGVTKSIAFRQKVGYKLNRRTILLANSTDLGKKRIEW